MASYGDIVEINGEFFEFTPVGYMPVSAPSTDGGMLTMPDDTITPSPTGDVIVKEEPTTTTQTEPTGTPTSDPTKTEAGETGPFDPNAEPPAPAPAPEPEAELAPPKPLQDTKEPAPEPEGISTFTFFQGAELGDATPSALYNRADATQVTQAELEEYFNADGSGMLRQAFGDFNNYLAYMTEREQLLQSGDYDVGNWDEYTGGLTEDELMLLEGEDLTQYGDDAASDMPELEQQRLLEQSSAYDRWVNSEANQALLDKYGVGSIIYNQDGDKYEWNGSAYVKTVKVDDHAGIGDYVKAGILTAMNYFAGGALTDALVSTGMSATLASGTSAGILNAATQYAATGEVDFGDALESALSAGLTTEVINQLTQSGVLDDIEESLNNLTQSTVELADGTQLPLSSDGLGAFVTLADGTQVPYADFITQAAEAGNAVVAEIERSLPTFLDTVADAFESSGTAQGVVNILEGMTTETQPYPGSESPQVTINIPEGVTAEVEEGEVPAEEDIFADTTQEATGLETSVIEDLFGNYMDEFRREFEGQQSITIEQVQEVIANQISNLPPNTTPEEIREIVNQAIETIPQADTLTENQIETIVSGAVNAIQVDLQEEISTGLGQAADERQELQEAIIAVGGNVDLLDEEMQRRFEEFGGTVEDLFAGVDLNITDLQEGLITQAEATQSLEDFTRSEFEAAEEERANLGGQLGTLTDEVAGIAEDLINVGGDIDRLDEDTQNRLNELGLDVENLGLLVNVNFEALQEGMLTRESAMQELIEETARETEEQVEGLGTAVIGGLEGLGEGIEGLGQTLGVGLLGLAGAQPTAQEIAAAMPREPVEFDPFLKGLSPFQPLTPLSLSPIKEKDATSELNKFIGRQTGMLV